MSAAGSVRDGLGAAVDALTAAGVDSPRLDAELMLCEATGWDRARLAAAPEAPVPASAAREFGAMMRRRLKREPIAFILGRRGFRNIELISDSRALVPRPETELLVDIALDVAPGRVLDIGTGSGAIALAIADEIPGCRVTATDTSEAALSLARENAAQLGLDGRVEFLAGSVPEGRFDLVVANLPYIPDSDWAGLSAEIREWEPRNALTSGADGLEAIRSVVPLIDADFVALEVGEGQAGEVVRILAAAGYGETGKRTDLSGIERVAIGRR